MTDVTMDDVSRIMREEDAQLLESIHLDQQSLSGSVNGNLSDNKHNHIEEIQFIKDPMNNIDVESSSHTNNHISSTHSRGDNRVDTEIGFRQYLSGEIAPFPSDLNSLDAAAKSPICPEREGTAPSSTTASVSSDVASNTPRSCERTNSSNRRISEAFQFAEAVGEMPPLDSHELCILEVDDDDDDSDEDDEEGENATVIRLQRNSIDDRLSDTGSTTQQCAPVETTTSTACTSTQQPADAQVDESNNETQLLRKESLARRKSRPRWPFQLPGWTFNHLDSSKHAHLEISEQDFVYKGIHSNPPEIVKRGISRGNHVQLHRKAWLEVSDKYHRYGKNLRLYYRYWESLGFPTNSFFDWLDSKGESAGLPLPNMEECPRSKLDSDSVLYITNPDVTAGYALGIQTVEGKARILDVDNEVVRTGAEGWIFVLRDGVMYGAEKITSISGHSKQRFHHSSFFGGKAVAAAGIIITDEEGFLTRLYPHSGHYRPREAHMQRLLYFLYHKGVDLRTFQMDTQQIMHVARDVVADSDKKKSKKASSKNNDNSKNNGDNSKKETEKKKKVDSLQLKPAVDVAFYVAHKAHFIGDGMFAQINQIRTANVANVTEAVNLLNGTKNDTTSTKDQMPTVEGDSG